jgi:hypothetical protein
MSFDLSAGRRVQFNYYIHQSVRPARAQLKPVARRMGGGRPPLIMTFGDESWREPLT